MNCVEFLKEYDTFLYRHQQEPLSKDAVRHLEVCENCKSAAAKLERGHQEFRSESYPGKWKIDLLVRLAPVIRFCGELDVFKALWKTLPVIAACLPLAVLGAIVLPDPELFLIALASICLAFHARAIVVSKRPPVEYPLLEHLPEPPAPLVSVSELIAFAEGRLPPKDTSTVMFLAVGCPDVAHDLKLVTAVLKHASGVGRKGLMHAVVSRN